MNKTKPFCISKQSVMEAWKKVKANRGAYGVDKESIEDFEANLGDNLYMLWNRMSSGSYFPPPVRMVEIDKADGRKRKLGVPTVSDRVAQGIAKSYLEPIVEPKFHADSYGYRPGKSALEAVGQARERCWQKEWAISLDIKGFFDNLDHELVMKAVRFHTDEKWIHLCVERWLKAPMEGKDGKLIEREQGTPQGGVISPLLANIFLHHAFDDWMRRNLPEVKFERYADDILLHCDSLKQAEEVREAVALRLQACNLELHPDKTKIVYCKNGSRMKGSYEHEQFDFLGYTFRPRSCMNKRKELFVGFTPAISDQASKRIRKEIRGWRLHCRSDKSIVDLARMFNAVVRGWVNYYGKYYGSAIYSSIRQIEHYLMRWVRRKYKKMRRSTLKAKDWLARVRIRMPDLFVHWSMGLGSSVG